MSKKMNKLLSNLIFFVILPFLTFAEENIDLNVKSFDYTKPLIDSDSELEGNTQTRSFLESIFSDSQIEDAVNDSDKSQEQSKDDSETIEEKVAAESSLGEKHSVYYGLSLSINGEEGGGDSLGYTHPTGFGIYTFLYAKIELPDVEEGETTEGAGYGYVLTYRKNLFDNYFLIGLGSLNHKGYTPGGNSSDETNFEGSIIWLVGYFYPLTDSFSILINAVSVNYMVKDTNEESYTNNGIFHIAGSYDF